VNRIADTLAAAISVLCADWRMIHGDH
jgi:hypothetical protein